jgi:hypothetical protein
MEIIVLCVMLAVVWIAVGIGGEDASQGADPVLPYRRSKNGRQ